MNDELERSPAERALAGHLVLLQAADTEDEADRSLARRIVRSARWQGAVRAPLRVAGMIATAALDGLLAFAGARRRRG